MVKVKEYAFTRKIHSWSRPLEGKINYLMYSKMNLKSCRHNWRWINDKSHVN